MKYAFILVLLLIAGSGGLLGAAVVVRFTDNMAVTPRVLPGQAVFPMPEGPLPRGVERVLPREEREAAARRPNPLRANETTVAAGQEHYRVFCQPCHGAEGKGGVTGPVATRFIPAPDLTNAELHRVRTDGYWHSYIMAGGAVMPAYGEALSSEEAWQLVHYLRTLAAR